MLMQDVDTESNEIDDSLVTAAYYLRKELGEVIDDDYSWIRFKIYCDEIIKDNNKQKKASQG